MALPTDPLPCECGREVPPDDAIRTETYADLDATSWQRLCCPTCGRALQTVFVGDE